jgi:Trk-type K+ transport system membrane component
MTDYQYDSILGLIGLTGIVLMIVGGLAFLRMLAELGKIRKLLNPSKASESPKEKE